METYLIHHGIMGQKWGVRRYQNEDGSLTPAGKKKYLNSDGSLNNAGKKVISKQYKKAQIKGDKRLVKNYNRLTVQAYNESADYMNGGGIEKFNKEQEKKYGKDFANREGYEEDYVKQFNDLLSKNQSKAISDFIDNDKDYQKAKNLVKKYEMLSWDKLAKSNSEAYDEFHKHSK